MSSNTRVSEKPTMNIDRFVLAFAGAITLVGLGLGYWVHHYWFFLSAFAGLNMFQAAFTGFCPLAVLLKKLGMRPGQAFR